jgi:CrcB protein
MEACRALIFSLLHASDTFIVVEENMLKSLIAVIVGGSAGCVIRWLLSVRLNALFPNLPPGTLLVNLTGGFIIGGALAFFTRQPHLDPTWRLLITTGLCGGMTTFSTFSWKFFPATGGQLSVGHHVGDGACVWLIADDRTGLLCHQHAVKKPAGLRLRALYESLWVNAPCKDVCCRTSSRG